MASVHFPGFLELWSEIRGGEVCDPWETYKEFQHLSIDDAAKAISPDVSEYVGLVPDIKDIAWMRGRFQPAL